MVSRSGFESKQLLNSSGKTEEKLREFKIFCGLTKIRILYLPNTQVYRILTTQILSVNIKLD
jgi:hypothetical protein